MIKIIGLGYRKRAGKDTVANHLCRQHDFLKTAFADPLKAAAKTIFGWRDAHVSGELKEVVDEYWGFSPRWALQRMGTEAMRGNIADDIWIKSTMKRITILGHTRVVISDVRFPNEAAAIKSAGGRVWRIDRPSLGPANDAHASETAMAGYGHWDAVIVNDGSLEKLAANIDELMAHD